MDDNERLEIPSLKLFANKVNGHFLRDILPGQDVEVEGVLAAIAYGNDSSTLIQNCIRNKRRLDIWMRYDHTVPVSPKLLQELLNNTSKNVFCFLVPDILHAKVVWWKGYGVYIGSANLTGRAWVTNIEFGVFISDIVMEEHGLTLDMEAFFEELRAFPEVFPLDQSIVDEQAELMTLRSNRLRALDDDSRKKRKVNIWEGPAFIEPKSSRDKRGENFLREWRDGLSYLSAIAEQAPNFRPAWLNEDVPAAWQADQFLHAYYYNEVADGVRHPFEEYYQLHRKDPAGALSAALRWWSALPESPSEEDYSCHVRAPVIRRLLSREKIAHLDLKGFTDICQSNHSTVDHVRRMSLDELGLLGQADTELDQRIEAYAQMLWNKSNERGEGVKDVLMYLLDGDSKADLSERLYEMTNLSERRISHFGTNQLAEIAGWARPESCPPRNGRTSKALRALGYDVKIY